MNRRRGRAGADAGVMAETVLLGALIASLLASLVGILTLLQAMRIGPPVGEILVFGPYDQPATGWHITARRLVDQRPCLLNPAIMAMAPGSMVVEQRRADGRRFQVHWAGGGTSIGDKDCGPVADLSLALRDMQALVNAAEAAHWHLVGR